MYTAICRLILSENGIVTNVTLTHHHQIVSFSQTYSFITISLLKTFNDSPNVFKYSLIMSLDFRNCGLENVLIKTNTLCKNIDDFYCMVKSL